jgi:hypothetical protein
MLGNPETGLPHPRVQADIADQLLRTGEAAHIAEPSISGQKTPLNAGV